MTTETDTTTTPPAATDTPTQPDAAPASPVLVAKMFLGERTEGLYQHNTQEFERVKLQAVNGAKGTANAQWSKYTPSGELSITITNPGAIEQFSIGEVYELRFEKAAKAE